MRCPSAPDWKIELSSIESLPWVPELKVCPQSPTHHAEGDVWTHTCMVVDALVGLPEFRRLPELEREVLYRAAWLHDLAKPECTRHESEGITARGHALRGSFKARRWLWEQGYSPPQRERVCGLIRHHMEPFWLIEREDAVLRLLRIAESTRCKHLALLARADALGRLCEDRQQMLDNIALFEELAREWGVWESPFEFDSGAARLSYFRSGGDPRRVVYFRPRCRVTVLSGLPASGKDHWVARHASHLGQLSLDDLRHHLGLSFRGGQHEVVQQARARARDYLRRGESFCWNATHLSRDLRERTLSLALDYQAEVAICYLEAPVEVLMRRNQKRDQPVPAEALERMIRRWEPPSSYEAHEVTYDWGT